MAHLLGFRFRPARQVVLPEQPEGHPCRDFQEVPEAVAGRVAAGRQAWVYPLPGVAPPLRFPVQKMWVLLPRYCGDGALLPGLLWWFFLPKALVYDQLTLSQLLIHGVFTMLMPQGRVVSSTS